MQASASNKRTIIMKWLNLLERADYHGSTEATLETLTAIQQSCMLAIPFENLDIHLDKKIELDHPRVYKKIVKANRGGFCYELNELFLQCLTEIGFSCTRVEAKVNTIENPQAFSHQTCLVQLEELWWSDIGFGDSSFIPVNLNNTEVQGDESSCYRVTHTENGMFEIFFSKQGADNQDAWHSLLTINPTPQPWSAFAEMCKYHQTSTESKFTQKRICSIRTSEGRLTLSGNTLITRNGHEKSEQYIAEADYLNTLETLFGISLDKANWVNPLASDI